MRDWREKTTDDQINRLASQLGVTAASLREIGAAWAPQHNAWAFVMRNAWGEPVGIRLRMESGRKFAVTGSHAGIFIPEYLLTKGRVMREYECVR